MTADRPPLQILNAHPIQDGLAPTHTLPAGLSIAQIVEASLPGARLPEGLRVVLSDGRSELVVPAHLWHRVWPKPGVQVIIRTVPGKDAVRAALLAVVAIAAAYLAPQVAGLFAISSKVGIALVGAGLSIVGNLLVGALIPLDSVAEPETAGRANSVSGWANRTRRDEPVPLVFGKRRFAPPFAATSYSEIIGDQQYIRALFCLGYGQLSVSDIRIGDTSIDNYDEVEIELREGLPGDDPVTLYPHQVLEEAENIELVRPLPRDDAGEITEGPSIETPVIRQTASDTQIVSVIFGFGSGLFEVSGSGSLNNASVAIRIRQRLKGDTVWQEEQSLTIRAANRTPFFRQHNWQLPERGTWEIELTRMSEEATSTNLADHVSLSALQSVRPEYPVNVAVPTSLLAVRVRATYQLNGTLQNLNCAAHRVGPIWDGQAWTRGLSRNPASAFLLALQGPSNPFPAPDDAIDWEAIAEWFEWCAARDLKFDFALEQSRSLGDLLRTIAAAGRALPRHDGARWSVVIDRPDMLVVDHINPRNSSGMSWSRGYFEAPDAFRITFEDETSDFEAAERIVPWPGHEGDINITEEITLPGKTDPDEIWREARRRQYELMHRSDSFTTVLPGIARSLTRGDLVMAAYDVLSTTHAAGRVTRVVDRIVELDTDIELVEGVEYGIRFRPQCPDEEDQGVLASVVRPVAGIGQGGVAFRLLSGTERPVPGHVVHIGPLGQESQPMKVRSIEGGQNMSTVLNLVAAAPQIDALSDQDTPPVWSGRVGTPIVTGGQVPPAPRLVSLTSKGVYDPPDERGAPHTPGLGTMTVSLVPSTGSAVILKDFQIEYRPPGAESWFQVVVPVANGSTIISDVMTEQVYELRAIAIAADGTPSLPGPTVTLQIGAEDAQIPQPLDDASIEATGGLGHANVTVATSADPATVAIRIFRTLRGASLNLATDAIGEQLSVSSQSTYSVIDGDATRANMLLNPDFEDATVWVTGTGWTLGSGQAIHAPGNTSTISQPATLTAGTRYRVGVHVTTLSAGTVRPEFSGGAAVQGAIVSTAGWARDLLEADAGNDTFVLSGNALLDCALNEVVLFPETPACIPAGAFDYYIQPVNADGLTGPVSGPFEADVL